jgi:hypothetical protein
MRIELKTDSTRTGNWPDAADASDAAAAAEAAAGATAEEAEVSEAAARRSRGLGGAVPALAALPLEPAVGAGRAALQPLRRGDALLALLGRGWVWRAVAGQGKALRLLLLVSRGACVGDGRVGRRRRPACLRGRSARTAIQGCATRRFGRGGTGRLRGGKRRGGFWGRCRGLGLVAAS